MAVTHGHEADHTRRSDGVRHARSRRARFAARNKKRACSDNASHVPRLTAVCNDYLRVWTAPAESHLQLENKARIAFFCKSRVNERYRAVAAIANDIERLLVTVGVGPGTPRGQLGRQSGNVQKSARVWRVDCDVRGCAPCSLWLNGRYPWSRTRPHSLLRWGPTRPIRSRAIRGPD